MIEYDKALHRSDLEDIKTEIDTLKIHGSATHADLSLLSAAVWGMQRSLGPQPKLDLAWLASPWVASHRKIYAENGNLLTVVTSPTVAEYLVTLHHKYIDVPYAGGQLEIDIAD